MIKEYIPYYLRLFAGLLLISPLVHAFIALDYGLLYGGIYAGILYLFILFPFGLFGFNYLETGHFTLFIKEKHLDKYQLDELMRNRLYKMQNKIELENYKIKIYKNKEEIRKLVDSL